ncbi:hypothetical protein LOC51_20020 [Rubrivivax sp. JA1024]|nr:hypothetical protein [Rubrivivax sp. JA1024]
MLPILPTVLDPPAKIAAQPIRLIDAAGDTVAAGTLPMQPGEWPVVVMLAGQPYVIAEAHAVPGLLIYQHKRAWIADGSLLSSRLPR